MDTVEKIEAYIENILDYHKEFLIEQLYNPQTTGAGRAEARLVDNNKQLIIDAYTEALDTIETLKESYVET